MNACKWLVCALLPLCDAGTLLGVDGSQLPELVVQGGTSRSFLTAARFSGPWVASVGSDQVIRVWRIETGHITRVLSGHQSQIEALAFSVDHKRLASIDSASEVAVWDLFSGALLLSRRLTMPQPNTVAFNGDGSLLFIGDREGGITVLDTKTKMPRSRLPAHLEAVNGLEHSENGLLLAAAASDGRVSLWNAQVGERLRYLDPPSTLLAPAIPFASERPDAIESVGVSRSGTLVVAGRLDGTVVVWSIDGSVISTLPGHGAGAMAVTFSADEKNVLAAYSDHTLAVWPTDGPQRVRWTALPHQAASFLFTLNGRWPVSFSDDARQLIYGSEISALSIFGIGEAKVTRELKVGTEEPRSIAFDPSGETLLLGMASGKLAWWDSRSGERSRMTGELDEAVTALAFSPDGTWFATGGKDRGVKIIDTASGKELRTIAPRLQAEKFALSPDGTWLATDGPGAVLLWDTLTGRMLRRLPQGPAGWSRVQGFAVSRDGRKLAFASNTIVKLWEVASGREIPLPRLNGAQALTFTSDGEELVLVTLGKTSNLKILHLSDGRVEEPPPVHSRLVSSLELSPDGQYLVSASEDGKVRLWTVGDWDHPRTIAGHQGSVRTAMFSRDAKLVLSTGSDGMTVLWDAASGERLLSLIELLDGSGWLAIAPDGLFDGKADALTRVSWRYGTANDTYSLDYFYNDYFHPGLLADILRSLRPRAQVNLALRLPGLRIMAQEGLAHIERSGGNSYLCLSQSPPTPGEALRGRGVRLFGRGDELALARQDFTVNPDNSACMYRRLLPTDGGPYELSAATSQRRFDSDSEAPERPSPTENSTLHVFTVGIDKYTDSGYDDLAFARADAVAICEFFERQAKSANRLFRQVRLWPALLDEQATLEAIREELAEMAKTVVEQDVVLLFFSGHGRLPPGKEMFYFIPYGTTAEFAMDAPPLEPSEVGLSTAMIAQAVRDLRARRIVVVIDSCQAGAAFDSLGKIADMKRALEERRDRSNSMAKDGSVPPIGVYLLAAASPLQEAKEAGHGLLTQAILRALGEDDFRAEPREIRMRWLTAKAVEELLRLAHRAKAAQNALRLAIGVDFSIATSLPEAGSDADPKE